MSDGAAGRAGACVVLYITAIVMCGGEGHEYISAVRWETPGARAIGESPLSAVLDFIEGRGGEVRVRDRLGNELQVGVVRGERQHIRAFAEHGWTDDLLLLPRYEIQ